jgi:hypothetical protein
LSCFLILLISSQFNVHEKKIKSNETYQRK